jgi:hypothetical protein
VREEREESVEGLEEVGRPGGDVLARLQISVVLHKAGMLRGRSRPQIDTGSPPKCVQVDYGVTGVVRTGGGNLPSSVGLGEAVV